ncbi:MAG: hypothetical protein IT443_13000 [Phycisphaeraceae bacterium]|nr:hypothetical protein [Phycisphaeraceae bacterium]
MNRQVAKSAKTTAQVKLGRKHQGNQKTISGSAISADDDPDGPDARPTIGYSTENPCFSTEPQGEYFEAIKPWIRDLASWRLSGFMLAVLSQRADRVQ